MLYKKYHRFYVRQFKKGIEFDCPTTSPDKMFERDVVDADGVEIRPYYGGVYVAGKRTGRWILVFSNGRINKKNLYAV